MDNIFGMLRSFLGLHTQPPCNDFRNPIWGDVDDEDGDDLYDRHTHMEVFSDPSLIEQELTRQMNEMMRSFGSIFGDMGALFNGGDFSNLPNLPDNEREPENFDSNSLRNYYLKPGFHNKQNQKEDVNLDGKISSEEISGLLKKKDTQIVTSPSGLDGVPGMSYCRTIITTSVTKPDGTVETRKIVKNGNEVTEETTTTIVGSEPKSPINMGLESVSPDNMYQSIFTELSSLWKNFH